MYSWTTTTSKPLKKKKIKNMTADLTGVCISMERLLFRFIIQSYYSGELF